MLRYKQQTRRDHVVSLLPPISVIKNKEYSLQERIYADSPPPMTYPGSFPAKVLRHLDKSTFYSTPTKGETMLAKKSMHDEETTKDKNSDSKYLNHSMDKKSHSHSDYNKKNKTIKIKTKIKKASPKNSDGLATESQRRCASAPGLGEAESEEKLPETGNLTAPVTPRLNAPQNQTRRPSGGTLRSGTPTRAMTPRRLASPDIKILEQDAEVMLELRGDSICHTDFRADTRPNSRINTQYDWQQKTSGTCAGKPKIRSAIREVPSPQNRIEKAPKEPQKFEIRAVGFSMIVHNKKESSFNSLRTKEGRNNSSKDRRIIRDNTIKIPSVDEGDGTVSSLSVVMEADDDVNGPESTSTAAKEPTHKEMNISNENENIASEIMKKEINDTTENVSHKNTENELSEKTENDESVKILDTKEPENENGNQRNETTMDNMSEIMKDKKEKKNLHKKGRRNSKIKCHKK